MEESYREAFLCGRNKALMMSATESFVVRFDDALPVLVSLALDRFGEDVFDYSLVLRDAVGRLTLVLRAPVSQDARSSFDDAARERLGAYVEGPTATPDELFDPSLNDDTEVLIERVPGTLLEIRLVDRRVVGQDWNRPNFIPAAGETPIVSFFSCKGGVGRSTALAVVAASLSDRGKKVLIVDLDLEAPGLGPIFLPSSGLPDYGALDYFVENGLGGVDDTFLNSCLASSPISAGRGLVEVLPSVGRIGRDNPQNVLPKLGRAFIDDPNGSDGSASFSDQARTLVRSLAERGRYDAILVDARSGLSENAAAGVVGLGGSVLLFGVDTPQTFEAYDYLLAHLNRFVPSVQSDEDWRYGLRMVHAKAARGPEAWERFRNRAQEMFAKHLYEEAGPEDINGFNFDFDDENAPHYAWPIPYDADYSEFDPLARSEQLSRTFFSRSFGPFTDFVWKLIFENTGQSGD